MNETPEDQQHRQTVVAQLSQEGRKYFKFIEFDANEQLVTEIRKHPFGLLLILLTGAFVVVAMLIMIGVASTINLDELFGIDTNGTMRSILVLIAFLLMLGAVVITFIAAFLYKSNVIFVTSEKIAQVLYVSLFNRKISQLSIGDVQDVTVTQKGIMAHLFKYGTLVVETAGEQQNYTFTFVPDPYKNSQMIVGAHERNLVAHGN